jgi:dsDNA-binding SOS-regulon protein
MKTNELVNAFFENKNLKESVHPETADKIIDAVDKILELADDIQRNLDLVDIHPNSEVAEELSHATAPFARLAQKLYDELHGDPEPKDDDEEFYLG